MVGEPLGKVPPAAVPEVGKSAVVDPELVDPEVVDSPVGELAVESTFEAEPFTSSVLRLIVTLASPKRTLMTPVTSRTMATTTRSETDRDPGTNFFAARRL